MARAPPRGLQVAVADVFIRRAEAWTVNGGGLAELADELYAARRNRRRYFGPEPAVRLAAVERVQRRLDQRDAVSQRLLELGLVRCTTVDWYASDRQTADPTPIPIRTALRRLHAAPRVAA